MSTALEVFAQKVEQERLARKIYLSKLKASPDEKKAAFAELKKNEQEVDSLLYAILHPAPSRPVLYQGFGR